MNDYLDIISEDEIDSSKLLLIEQGSNQKKVRKIKAYDFKHPKLVSKEIMRALRKIHELYARNLKRLFATSLNMEVEVRLEDIEQVVFSEYLSAIEPPAALFLFNIEELGDWAVLQMDSSFCLFFVERLSGGRTQSFEEPRNLTHIEERVMSRFIDKMFKELSHVWSTHFKMTILNHVYESKPANIRAISSHVPGIAISFTVKVKDKEIPVNISYPYGLLKEKMVNSLNRFEEPQKNVGLNPVQKRRFEEDLKEVQVTLKTLLGETDIKMDRLARLKEGDIIELGQLIDEPLKIMTNQSLKLWGYPGTMNGKKAVKIFKIAKQKLI